MEKWRDPWTNTALRRGGVSRAVSVIPHAEGAFLSAPVFVKKSGREALAGGTVMWYWKIVKED